MLPIAHPLPCSTILHLYTQSICATINSMHKIIGKRTILLSLLVIGTHLYVCNMYTTQTHTNTQLVTNSCYNIIFNVYLILLEDTNMHTSFPMHAYIVLLNEFFNCSYLCFKNHLGCMNLCFLILFRWLICCFIFGSFNQLTLYGSLVGALLLNL